MTNIRNWINLVENTDIDREFYINQANEFRVEQKLWWPVSKELMAEYNDGSHTEEWADGTLLWYKNGKEHRDDDKPARILADGRLEWYKNGLLHRDGDKPALIDASGSLWWFKNRLFHRDGDKPAVIDARGGLAWYKNNKLHRVLGPAVIDDNNKFVWWFKNKKITVRSQDRFEKYLKKHYPFDNEIKQLYY